MSGHSKWAQIKRQKAVVDAKRGSLFTKLAKAITVAAREGGTDPAANSKLRLAIDKALAANMPKDNITRATLRASNSAESTVTAHLEAYGPGGVALIIEVATDNRNRTVAEIRHLLSEHDSSLGKTGSVTWQFERVAATESTPPTFVPKQTVLLDATARAQLTRLIEQLQSRDDVVDVISNLSHG